MSEPRTTADEAIDSPSPSAAALGIGALSRATGVPVETLRTWERRYGFPAAQRDQAGQRTYDLQTTGRLQLIRQALDLGLRAARVVPLPLGELERLLRETPGRRPEPGPSAAAGRGDDAAATPEPAAPETLEAMLAMVQRYDGAALASEMARAWQRLGAVPFLDDVAGPLMAEVGRRWADGRLSVAHEHFASEQLRAQLSAMVGGSGADAPAVICATLPGELHALGLQMAAVTAQMAGLRAIYLGADVPLIDLARAAQFAGRDGRLRAVVVSISRSVEAQHARDQLSQLRSLLPDGLALLVGGAGAPSGVAGVQTLASLRALLAWSGEARQGARV